MPLLAAVAVSLLALASPAYAEEPKPAAPFAAQATATLGLQAPGAELVVFNRTVFVFRGSFLGVPPEDRARAARERIAALLQRPGAHAVTVETIPQGAIVKLDGAYAFAVVAEDADVIYGESAVAAATRAAKALELVTAETHESRNLTAMLVAAGLAGAATAIFAALAWGLRRGRRALNVRLGRLAMAHVQRLRIGGVAVMRADTAVRVVRRLLGVAYWALLLLIAYEWVGYVLSRFPYTRPWGERLTDFLLGAARGMLEGIAGALPELAIAVVIFVIARAVSGGVSRFMRRVQTGEVEVGWLDADTARPTRQIVTIVIWLFALVMAYPYLPGSDTDAFKGVSVLVGLMVSLGASSVVAQGASGLILMYTRTVRPGEYVRIGEHEGTVVELGMFATRIRTGMGEELTLPSAFILGTVTRNYSRTVKGEGFVVDAAVTIGYDAPWRQVHAMLDEAARRTEGVLADPAPRVYQTALSDFYVEYRLVCEAMPAEPRPRAEVMSALHANIQDVFNEYGVQIMSPHYLGDPGEAKIVPKSRWHAAPAEKPDSGTS
jgi:small-conductance mechanosensitive channel